MDNLEKAMNDFPRQPQRQDSIKDQFVDLITMANKMGCYDAADFLREHVWEITRKDRG